MDLKQYLKGKSAETILKIVENKTNMYKEGLKADKLLDKTLGSKFSEKIQRGSLTSMLMRFLDGLFAESPEALAVTYELAAKDIRRNLNKGGKK